VHVRLHVAGETYYAPWVEALRVSGHHAVVGYATPAVASVAGARRSRGAGDYALQGYGTSSYSRGTQALPELCAHGGALRPEVAPAVRPELYMAPAAIRTGLCMAPRVVRPGAVHGAAGYAPPATRPGRKDNALLTSDSAAPARLTLPAQRRLRRKSDFDAAYAGGRKFGNGFFGVTAFWNDKGWARIGLAVAVRTAGGGVERNRIRRIIRESFRLHQHELPGVDLIVSARGRAKDAPGPELHASLVALWKKVKEQCATSPRS